MGWIVTDTNNNDASSGREELLAEQARLAGVLSGLQPAIGGTSGGALPADRAETRQILEERLEEVGRKLNQQAC